MQMKQMKLVATAKRWSWCQSLQIIRSLQSTDARRVWDAIAMNDKKDDKPAADQLEPGYR